MRKLVEVPEEGFEALLGERITLFCVNYIYTGKLMGVNDRFVMLESPAFAEKTWKDAQPLPHPIYVMLSSVEAFGVLK